ncbi:Agmatinase [Hartmannibacter diazotrophicus]|uniref:Agmatinase n=1 Tax=Hartmannibacter diazotrophicus TaxID=1482074 RepID=A0A2C9D6R5_9HYPH|nr:agmatinase [Hartmannibacter diazotrophicus]SON55997.1 Agmatinase [Hartmannibacter diazotrophicus]
MRDDDMRPRPTDHAFLRPTILGGATEPTYGGTLSFMRRMLSRELENVDAVVWGIPFDSAVSNRSGARFGPQAIRRASAIFDGDPNYPFGFDIFEELAVVDWGDCSLDYGRPQDARLQIEAQAGEILDAGCHLFTLGGDHYVTWPLLRAHAERFGPLSLIQFDAHQDTWHGDDDDRVDHGAFVAWAVRHGIIDPSTSIQVGIRTHAPEDCGLEILYGHDIDRLGIAGVLDRICNRVGDNRAYMTFDIDCLDPAFAPGTGTPVSGGLTTREMIALITGLEDIDFVGGDVVEVAPAYDHADITAIAASTVAQSYLGLLAAKKRGG